MQLGQLETKGFLGALFDFGFTSFITLRFLKVIYAILVGLILLTGLLFFVSLLLQGEAVLMLLAIVGVPLVTLLYLVIARVYMEIIALFFRIGENTSVMAASLGGSSGGPGSPYSGPSYGGPAPGPAAPAGSGL